MSITTETDLETYESFVLKNEGSFLQSLAWGKWQEKLSRNVYRYIVKEDSNNVVLAAQLIEHHTPLGNYLYSPYGPTLNEKFKIQNSKSAIEDLIRQIKIEHSDILFIRLEPTFKLPPLNYKLTPAEHTQPDQTLVLDISKTESELLESFHPKTRYNIKVAQKNGVTVETSTAPNKDVVDLIMQTSERKQYRNHDREYIEQLWEFFSKEKSSLKVTGYMSKVDGRPAAGALMVDYGKTRMYLFGGSNYELRKHMAPYLLHWTAIMDAKKLELTSYDFGASETASGNSGGFMRFKLGFSPNLVQFGGTWDLVNRSSWYTMYKWLRKFNRYIKHVS